jgi:hypothetical protein
MVFNAMMEHRAWTLKEFDVAGEFDRTFQWLVMNLEADLRELWERRVMGLPSPDAEDR